MTARDIAKALNGRKAGSGWEAWCPSHDDRHPSLSVRDGVDGQLLGYCHAGCTWGQIRDALQARGLLPEHDPRRAEAHQRRRTARRCRRDTIESQVDADEQRRIEAARQLWRKAVPATPETPVASYLRARGITIPVPPSIRYLANTRHGPTGTILPAMVAAVQGPDGKVSGVLRTFLRADGQGKARVSQCKMMLGRCASGAVRLAKAGPTLAVAEGIETALSVMQTGLPTWAALSTGGIEALILPPPPLAAEVVIFADHDRHRRGIEAAYKAANRWYAQRRRVRIALPPEPGTDFNDLLGADGLAGLATLAAKLS